MGLAAFAVAETMPPPQARAPASRANNDTAFDAQVHAALRESPGEDPLRLEIDRDVSDRKADAVESDASAGGAAITPEPPVEIVSPVVLQFLAPQEQGGETLTASALASGAGEQTAEGASPLAEPASAEKQGKAEGATEQPTPQPATMQNVGASAQAVAAAQTKTAPTIQATVDQASGAKASEVAPPPLAAAPPVRLEPANAQAKQAKSAPVESEKSDAKAASFAVDSTSDAAPATANARAAKAERFERSAASIAQVDPHTHAPAPATNSLTSSLSPTLPQHVSAQHTMVEHAAAQATPAIAQVAREIIRRFDGGNTRFEVRLDPPELGRVEVRLDVSRDHRVTAVVAADSPQALAELMRHARDLEQTLQSAGLELAENGLSFDLRQGAQDSEDARHARKTGGETQAEVAPEAAPPIARPLGYERWRGVRIDMMV